MNILKSASPVSLLKRENTKMPHAIETKQLTKTYGSLKAVDSLDINVEPGEIFGLLGPNGAGKTTVVSMLCTILKPTSGSMYGS